MTLRRFRFLSLFAFASAGAWLFACGSSSSGADDTALDGSADASSSDQFAPLDSSARDAALDAAKPPFCQSQSPTPFFCADFDEADLRTGYVNGDPVVAFVSTLNGDGGTLGAGASDLSPPTALHVSMSAGALLDTARYTESSLGAVTGGTHIRLVTNVRFDSVGDLSGSAYLTFLVMGMVNPIDANSFVNFQFATGSNQLHLFTFVDGTEADAVTLGAIPAAGATWIPVTFDFVLGKSATITFGNRTPVVATNRPRATDTAPTAMLGMFDPHAGALEMSYDDIVVTVDEGDAGDGG